MNDEPSLVGRPTSYTKELGDFICSELAIGKSLRSVCREEHMPHVSCIFRWLRTYPEFHEQYVAAKEESADAHSEDILDIADNATNDWMETADDEGGVAYRLNGENIQRSKLRVDTRKWLASKLKPKKYGDKTAIVGPDNGPLQVEFANQTSEQLLAHARDLLDQFPELLKGKK